MYTMILLTLRYQYRSLFWCWFTVLVQIAEKNWNCISSLLRHTQTFCTYILYAFGNLKRTNIRCPYIVFMTMCPPTVPREVGDFYVYIYIYIHILYNHFLQADSFIILYTTQVLLWFFHINHVWYLWISCLCIASTVYKIIYFSNRK